MLKQRLQAVRERMDRTCEKCGRDPATVRLVAVSKTMPADRVAAAIEAGAAILGENYIQEAHEKVSALSRYPVSWHFIGHLQTNKAKYAVRIFDMIHTLDRLKLARELNKQAAKIDKIQPVLVQVNISGEQSKSGIEPQETEKLLHAISPLEHIQVRGLMTMPPFFDQPEKARPFFKSLYTLSRQIAEAGIAGVSMDELSMGMSGDFEVAIEQGATLVRVGTAIFGERQ